MKGAAEDPSGWRLPALKLERAVCGAIVSHLDEVGEKLFCDPDPIAVYRAQDALGRVRARLGARDGEMLRVITQRVRVSPNRLYIDLDRAGLAEALDTAPSALAEDQLAIKTGFELRRRGVEIKIITGQFERAPDQTLINAIAKAHQWLTEARRGVSLAAIGRRYGWTDSPIRQRIRLAFLSPDITAAILEGRQPPELTLQHLLTHPIPLDWDAQARVLGFSGREIPCSAR